MSKQNTLLAWIGMTDLRASRGELQGGLGPIGQAATDRNFTHVFLLSNYYKSDEKAYLDWLTSLTTSKVKIFHQELTSPTHFGEIYEADISLINKIEQEAGTATGKLTFHLSPGTPAMAAVWILLAKTVHPAELIESSVEHGVKTVLLPFDIFADYLPHISDKTDDEIVKLTQGLPPLAPEFDEIIYRCDKMKKLVAQARRIAIHDVPVIIQGESGTGKELFARAIHASSHRSKGPFVDVNCGAIPPELIESEFFGYEKGAFTGAVASKAGYIVK